MVGTAHLDDHQQNARGRILLIDVTESRQLKIVAEQALKGACRCLGMVSGRIVAALIKTIVCTHSSMSRREHFFRIYNHRSYGRHTHPVLAVYDN